VGWRATGGESVGPYVRNSIRPDVLASLLASGEAQRLEGRRRETALPGKSPERKETSAVKRIWKDIGWLETERQGSSGVMNRGDPLLVLNEAVEVRASIGAGKRRNGRGAKGGRKVNA
jgi:hypothetical protein